MNMSLESTPDNKREIQEPIVRIKYLSPEETAEEIRLACWKACYDSASRLRYAWARGVIEGWAETKATFETDGRSQAIADSALAMLDNGKKISEVAKFTGLNLEISHEYLDEYLAPIKQEAEDAIRELNIPDPKAEAKAEGVMETRAEVARAMMQAEMPLSQVAKFSGLALKELKELGAVHE
jgi:hypothetical protein